MCDTQIFKRLKCQRNRTKTFTYCSGLAETLVGLNVKHKDYKGNLRFDLTCLAYMLPPPQHCGFAGSNDSSV
jgi:hypothetical protein